MVFQLAQCDSINHVCLFLTGSQPIPEGFGGAVYLCWPKPQPAWYLLGFIANEKPSVIFKIAKVSIWGLINFTIVCAMICILSSSNDNSLAPGMFIPKWKNSDYLLLNFSAKTRNRTSQPVRMADEFIGGRERRSNRNRHRANHGTPPKDAPGERPSHFAELFRTVHSKDGFELVQLLFIVWSHTGRDAASTKRDFCSDECHSEMVSDFWEANEHGPEFLEKFMTIL